ncbi:gamma-glutamylcyclotransferase [soil metagenome]
MPAHLSMLFVYGTLRRDSDAPMARLLWSRSQWIGAAQANGRLYRLDGYPGFVPDPRGRPVLGDVFALDEPEATLLQLDDYEECTARFAQPHEYRREIITVRIDSQDVAAWAYVYAWPVDETRIIATGDYLA